MKKRLEQAFYLGTAAISVFTPFGLDPLIAGLLLAVMNLGLALCAEIQR
jgi:hypothetical protein